MLHYCHSHRLVARIADALCGDKSPKLRSCCARYLLQVVEEWQPGEYERAADAVESAVRAERVPSARCSAHTRLNSDGSTPAGSGTRFHSVSLPVCSRGAAPTPADHFSPRCGMRAKSLRWLAAFCTTKAPVLGSCTSRHSAASLLSVDGTAPN